MFKTEGVGIFDTRVMNVFIKNIAPYYIGANVKLSNGEKGKIIYVPPHDIIKPIVAVKTSYLDLSQTDIKVIKML